MGWFNFTTGITASAEYTTSQTLSSSTQFVLVNANAGNVIITLPAAADNPLTIYTIKKIDPSIHTVKIDANSNETIDGELTIDLTLQYSYITIVCDGDEWFIIGGEYVKMEGILEEIKDILEGLRVQDEKGLLYRGKLLKHLEDFTEAEPDEETIEEELKAIMVETAD